MERKFATNKDFEAKYKEFIQEYLDLEHMAPIHQYNNANAYYIPHQAVIREDSTINKIKSRL